MFELLRAIFILFVLSIVIRYWVWLAIPVGLWFFSFLISFIYRELNPEAKRAYLERKEKAAEETRKRKEKEIARERLEKEYKEAERKRKEHEHVQHRDGEQQTTPYTYKIDQHGNESLAIRYGISNQEKITKEYWYYAKGGERKRNPDRDRIFFKPATTIRLKKTRKIRKDLYEVLLSDYRDRKARAVIEAGTEYVKTFYPLNDSWFDENSDLENTLKGNGSFTLKELATFHVQKIVGS
jgi:hypothetical protein